MLWRVFDKAVHGEFSSVRSRVGRLLFCIRWAKRRRSQCTKKLTGKFLTDALTHFDFSDDGDRVLQTGAFLGSASGPSTTTTSPIKAPTSI